MSHFMSFIPSFGLSDRPPESNVTPLPTSASVGPSPPFKCDRITTRGGRELPRATASSEAQRSCSSFG